jgi:O-antigen/teichoic acid export membrane protein
MEFFYLLKKSKKLSFNKNYLFSLLSLIFGKLFFIVVLIFLENHLDKNNFSEILLFFSIQASFMLFALIGSDEIYIKNYDNNAKIRLSLIFFFKVIFLILFFFIISYFFFNKYSINKTFFSFTLNNYDLILISSLSYFFSSITRIDSKCLFFIIIENFIKNFIVLVFVLILWNNINLNNFSEILRYAYLFQLALSVSYLFYIFKNKKKIINLIQQRTNLFQNFKFTFLRNLYSFSMSGLDILLISFISLGFVLADYRIAAISAGLFSIFLNAINVILLPEYSSRIKTNNLTNINKDYNQKTFLISLISIPILIFSIFLFDFFVELFLKNNYYQTSIIFKILVSAQFINILLGPTQYLIFLFDKNFKLNFIYSFFIVINLMVFIISLMFGGIILLASMIFISNLIFRLINLIILKKLNFEIISMGKFLILIFYSTLLGLSFIL